MEFANLVKEVDIVRTTVIRIGPGPGDESSLMEAEGDLRVDALAQVDTMLMELRGG